MSEKKSDDDLLLKILKFIILLPFKIIWFFINLIIYFVKNKKLKDYIDSKNYEAAEKIYVGRKNYYLITKMYMQAINESETYNKSVKEYKDKVLYFLKGYSHAGSVCELYEALFNKFGLLCGWGDLKYDLDYLV